MSYRIQNMCLFFPTPALISQLQLLSAIYGREHFRGKINSGLLIMSAVPNADIFRDWFRNDILSKVSANHDPGFWTNIELKLLQTGAETFEGDFLEWMDG